MVTNLFIFKLTFFYPFPLFASFKHIQGVSTDRPFSMVVPSL